MESCTGFMVANAMTDIAGCSDVFKGGFLAYNENVKRNLGVPFDIMRRGGVYSKEVAADKAEPGTVSLAIAQEGKEKLSMFLDLQFKTSSAV